MWVTRYRIWLPLSLLLLLGCAKSPGEIAVTLNVDALTDPQKVTIESFILMTADPQDDAKDKVLYPQGCVELCPEGATSCTPGEACLSSTTCGFVAQGEGRQDPFEAKIDFSSFPEGENVNVIACGMDSTQAVVASGSGEVTNTTGETASITMTTADECTGVFPPLCS